MNKDNIIFKFFNHIEEVILSVSFATMAIVCFTQVITRYIFKFSLPWSEELLRALFVWSSCLGISLGFRTRSHLGVDAVVGLFPKKIRRVLSFLAYLVVIAFCVVIIFYSVRISAQQFSTMQKTIAMRLPIFYISSAIPIGFGLTIVRILQVLYEDFVKHKKDSLEEGKISEGLL